MEFRTLITFDLKAGARGLHWHLTEWQDGTLTKVVSDGHVKSAYGVAWLEVRPAAISGESKLTLVGGGVGHMV